MAKKIRPVVLIKADGTVKRLEFDKKISLEQLQQFVNGYIEIVPVRYEGKRQHMIVNEEGFLERLPVNNKACAISGQFIVGNVAIVRYLT